jgi:hypothetical protein
MRLWTLHPKYLDARGLVAAWREALLAQAVLRGRTKGYRRHPQLTRFRAAPAPVRAIAFYLRAIRAEAVRRGYRFDAARIAKVRQAKPIPATRGQIEYEWEHLKAKLRQRDPTWLARLGAVASPTPHPLFRVVPGPVEAWERGHVRR